MEKMSSNNSLSEKEETSGSEEYESSSDESDIFQGECDMDINDEYTLIERLGKGGFGVVWAASEKKTQQRFALKVGRDKEESTREIEALEKVGVHSHIIPMFKHFFLELGDYEETGLGKYLTIVYPEYKQDLETYIRDCEGISINEIRTIFPKLLHGLQFAHQQGVVHTDLKPNNIFINLNTESETIEEIVIGDFGSATWDDSLCKYGKTSCYRSVNIILDEAPRPEDDIWSMGCILFEAVTDQYLFDPDIPDMEEDEEIDIDDINKHHLLLMLEMLGPFPRKLALKHRDYFNAKGALVGNPHPTRLNVAVIFENESSVSKETIPILARLITSMLKYTRRQRALIPEILDDPFFT